jgi:hypothetical protein
MLMNLPQPLRFHGASVPDPLAAAGGGGMRPYVLVLGAVGG